MTKADWASCDDPQAMLTFLEGTGRLTERKARLLAAAACRHIPDVMASQGWQWAVEAAEGLVEGLPAHPRPGNWRRLLADLAGAVTASPLALLLDDLCQWPVDLVPIHAEPRRREQADLVRCIFGPLPFRTPRLDPCWLTPLVLSLATAAYEERVAPDPSRPGWLVLDPVRLLVLADALEEAGCDEQEILEHLRVSGEHVRGWWCVDLLLAKEPTHSPTVPAAEPELVRFRPSSAEGLPDVREVVVHPDRLEVNTAGSWVTFPFSRIGRRQESRLASLARRLAGRAPWPPVVAERDWFHPPPARFFLWFTDPPLRTCMPEDEPADHAASHFSRIQAVLAKGGYATYDLG
jgi:hypothetical protein